MKKLLLICATIALLSGLVYAPILLLSHRRIQRLTIDSGKLPEELNGWKIKDRDMAESPNQATD